MIHRHGTHTQRATVNLAALVRFVIAAVWGDAVSTHVDLRLVDIDSGLVGLPVVSPRVRKDASDSEGEGHTNRNELHV